MPRTSASSRAIGACLAAAAVLLTASACGRQTAGATEVSTSPSPAGPGRTTSAPPAEPSRGNSGPPSQEKLDKAADAIEQLAASYPDSYTGLVVDNPGERLVVYRKKEPRFDSALSRLHTGVRVDLRDAPRSREEIQATRDRLVPLMGRTSGYRIWTVGAGSELSYTRGAVEVGVTGDLELAKRELGAKFGDRITVVATEPPSAG